MTCRKCRVGKPVEEFYGARRTCKACLAAYSRQYYQTHGARDRRSAAGPRILGDGDEAGEIPRELPREDAASVAVFVKAETFHHARCQRPLLLVGYRPSSEEIHFRCQPCSENVFLPTVAVERLATR